MIEEAEKLLNEIEQEKAERQSHVQDDKPLDQE